VAKIAAITPPWTIDEKPSFGLKRDQKSSAAKWLGASLITLQRK
jgi:hypothetical protein